MFYLHSLMKHKALAAWFFSLLAMSVSISQAVSAEPEQAAKVVDEFHAELLDVMQNGERLGYEGRFEKLKPIITAHFDTPLIAEVILGRYWNDLEKAQQQQFVDLFETLSVATYANRFSSYDGESFQHVGTEPLNKGRLLIKTELRQPDGETVKLDYLMQHRVEQWYIISVVAQGVNDLSLKRAEYTSIMKNRGFDGLVEELRGKIAQLESTS